MPDGGRLLKSNDLFKACTGASPPSAAVCQTGVMDYILHPVEPFAVRLSLTGRSEGR
jgi:hypothetical protein